MKKMWVGFSKPKKWFKPFSWAIRLVEGTPYSHVYFRIYSEGLDVDLIYQASGSQVNFVGLQHFEDHAMCLAEFEVPDIDPADYRVFMREAIKTAGADYSIKQPLGIFLIKVFNLTKNPFHNGKAAWVCSELVGYGLSNILKKINISEKEIEIMGPKGIFDICKANFKQVRGTI